MVAVGLVACVLYANRAAADDNAADIAEIKKLYAQINRDIEAGKYKTLYLYRPFPANEWLLQETETEEVRNTAETIVIYYRKGYVAKIRTYTIVDSAVTDEYYFRENGVLFFQFEELWAHSWDGDGKEALSLSEERHYVNARGRLIRHLHEYFRTSPNGKKTGVESSDNQMTLDLEAKGRVLSDVREFEFYKRIEKYVAK